MCPVIRKTAKGILVKVGSVPTRWKRSTTSSGSRSVPGTISLFKWLPPGEKAEAEFPINDINVKARSFCNVHGLWTNRA